MIGRRSWIASFTDKATRLSGWSIPFLLICLLFDTAPLSAQAPIQYVYDARGRLIAVADQNGNAAAYLWDEVGNLLAIERANVADLAGPVGITLVSPTQGRVGTEVHLFGKGFGATAAANTITFNGTPATVTAATTAALTTTVPAGAATGPITVLTPLGSASSTTTFRVLAPITLSPAGANLSPGATQQFTAFEGGSPVTNVIWSVNGRAGGTVTSGTISAAGLYAAPATVPVPPTVTVTATSKNDPRLSASALVGFLPPQPLFLSAPAVSVRLTQAPTVDRNLRAAISIRVTEGAGFAKAAPVSVSRQPVLTGVSPAGAAAGSSRVSLTLTGSGFTGATAVTFLRNDSADSAFTVTRLSVKSGGMQATMTVAIAAGAPSGPRVVQITTTAGTSTRLGTGANLFTVQ